MKYGLIILLSTMFLTADQSVDPRSEENVWHPVGGEGISDGIADYQSIVVDSQNRAWLAYRDQFNDSRTAVLKWNGEEWLQAGGFVSESSASYQQIALGPEDTPWVVFRDLAADGKTTVMRWDDEIEDWELVGEQGFSAGSSSFQQISVDDEGNAWVAYRDQTENGKITVKRWQSDSSQWEVAGERGIGGADAEFLSMDLSPAGEPWIAFKKVGTFGRTAVIRWDSDSGEWKKMAKEEISTERARHQSLVFHPDGNPWLAYEDYANGRRVTVQRYDIESDSWSVVGEPGISDSRAWFQTLRFDPSGDAAWVTFRDGGEWEGPETWRTTVMHWDGDEWFAVGGRGISNNISDHTTMDVGPDGTPWVAYQDFSVNDRATVRRWQPPVDIDSPSEPDDPTFTTLNQNYPNPFNSVTTISFELPRRAHVVIEVFTSDGKKVERIVDRAYPMGRHEVPFNATGLASGVYLYRMNADGIVNTKEMVYIK